MSDQEHIEQAFETFAEMVTKRLKPDAELRWDVQREIQAHLEDTYQAALDEGMSEEEARAHALKCIGNPDQLEAQLYAANRRRMRLRSVVRWTIRTALPAVCALMVAFAVRDGLRAGPFSKINTWRDLSGKTRVRNGLTGDQQFMLRELAAHDLEGAQALAERWPQDATIQAYYVGALSLGPWIREADERLFREMIHRLEIAEAAEPQNAYATWTRADALFWCATRENTDGPVFTYRMYDRQTESRAIRPNIANRGLYDQAIEAAREAAAKPYIDLHLRDLRSVCTGLLGTPSSSTELMANTAARSTFFWMSDSSTPAWALVREVAARVEDGHAAPHEPISWLESYGLQLLASPDPEGVFPDMMWALKRVEALRAALAGMPMDERPEGEALANLGARCHTVFRQAEVTARPRHHGELAMMLSTDLDIGSESAFEAADKAEWAEQLKHALGAMCIVVTLAGIWCLYSGQITPAIRHQRATLVLPRSRRVISRLALAAILPLAAFAAYLALCPKSSPNLVSTRPSGLIFLAEASAAFGVAFICICITASRLSASSIAEALPKDERLQTNDKRPSRAPLAIAWTAFLLTAAPLAMLACFGGNMATQMPPYQAIGLVIVTPMFILLTILAVTRPWGEKHRGRRAFLWEYTTIVVAAGSALLFSQLLMQLLMNDVMYAAGYGNPLKHLGPATHMIAPVAFLLSYGVLRMTAGGLSASHSSVSRYRIRSAAGVLLLSLALTVFWPLHTATKAYVAKQIRVAWVESPYPSHLVTGLQKATFLARGEICNIIKARCEDENSHPQTDHAGEHALRRTEEGNSSAEMN